MCEIMQLFSTQRAHFVIQLCVWHITWKFKQNWIEYFSKLVDKIIYFRSIFFEDAKSCENVMDERMWKWRSVIIEMIVHSMIWNAWKLIWKKAHTFKAQHDQHEFSDWNVCFFSCCWPLAEAAVRSQNESCIFFIKTNQMCASSVQFSSVEKRGPWNHILCIVISESEEAFSMLFFSVEFCMHLKQLNQRQKIIQRIVTFGRRQNVLLLLKNN